MKGGTVMSTRNKCLLALALMLAVVIAGAMPAVAQQRGIWVMIDQTLSTGRIPWTLTIINLTNYRLLMTNNTVQVHASTQDAVDWQSPPFMTNMSWPYNLVNLDSYRTMTWKSNGGQCFGCNAWTGMMTFVPEGMDPAKWGINLFFTPQSFQGYLGTWVFMTLNYNAPYWPDNVNDLACPNASFNFNTRYNILALYGTDLAVALYAPYITDHASTGVTLVFRQRLPHIPISNGVEDILVAPGIGVCYQDNNAAYM
jgi:hypothetical protein